MKKSLKNFSAWLVGLSLLYLLTHLIGLTTLPVFADEAIYLRWAQLIIDDWRQYLFFPMNDGKTPLFIWLLVGPLKIFSDPLLAGRLVAVMAGFAQWWLGVKIIKQLGGKGVAQLVAALSFSLLPFWYFHHRMALMDGWLVVLLSASYLLLLKATQTKKNVKLLIISGLSFGLALLTKIPALLFIPSLILAPILVKPKKATLAAAASWSSGVLLVGLVVFLSLKLHPAFGQLFNRGNDFLYSFEELLSAGVWPVLIGNSRAALMAFGRYLTWPIVLLPLAGLFQDSWRRKHALLILSSLGFLLPILLLGKTIYPRYLLPAALPLTLSAALVFEQFLFHTQRRLKKPFEALARSIAIVLVITFTVSTALEFTLISWQNPGYLSFVPVDRQQYLADWSSGHGIKETTELLVKSAQYQTIAVATEGYFGTLPDGMLMYLHNQDVRNIKVEGIGQPVREIPLNFRQRAQEYDRVWLVVNSHREKIGLATTTATLLQSYPRFSGAPSLEVWDITSLVHSAEQTTE